MRRCSTSLVRAELTLHAVLTGVELMPQSPVRGAPRAYQHMSWHRVYHSDAAVDWHYAQR